MDRKDQFQGLNYKKEILPYMEEYYNGTMFDRFTGGPDSAIYVKRLDTGAGDDIVYNQRQNFDPTIKIGNERLLEAEDKLTYGVERVRVGFFRFGTRITNRDLQELQINHKFTPDIRAQLLWQGQKVNTDRMMRQFGLAFADNVTRDKPNQEWSYSELVEKMMACGIDEFKNGEAISRSRVMFGLDKGLDKDEVNLALNVATMDDADADTLTVDHIFKLADLAGKGSRTNVANKEHAIRPYKVGNNRMGFPNRKYLLLTSSDAYFKLSKDPAWVSQMSRGVIEQEEQPSILFGSNYKGTVHGVMVVTIPEFSNYVFDNGAGMTCGYSCLLGAGAIGLGIGQNPHFATESWDYEMHHGFAHIEISGAKVLKFPSKIDLSQKGVNKLRVENGMIHSFVRLN